MHTNNLNTVKVIFADSKYNYETNVILNSGVIFEVNSKIALTKNS